LQQAFEEIADALAEGSGKRETWDGSEALMPVLLGDNAQAIANSLLAALRQGCSEEQLAEMVVDAAALRIAQFSTNNDFNEILTMGIVLTIPSSLPMLSTKDHGGLHHQNFYEACLMQQ